MDKRIVEIEIQMLSSIATGTIATLIMREKGEMEATTWFANLCESYVIDENTKTYFTEIINFTVACLKKETMSEEEIAQLSIYADSLTQKFDVCTTR